MIVRPGAEDDLGAINAIYNRYIATTPFTFDVEPYTPALRLSWFGHYAETGRHRLFVAEVDTSVVGYATSSPFRPRPAYETSVETSIYVALDHGGRGIGTALYEQLFSSLNDEDVHRAYAGITMPNPASVSIHERFGFSHVGTYSQVGRKFGKYWDVAWYEKELA